MVVFAITSVQFSHPVVFDSLQPPWTAARQASLSITNSQSLPKLTSIEPGMPSNHIILCRPPLSFKDISNSFQFFTVTNSATQSTCVFPENMLLDVELLVKRVGHSKILTVPNYWTTTKNCLCNEVGESLLSHPSLCQHRISSVLKSANLVCVLYWYLWVLICISLIIREVEDLFICILTVFLFSIKYLHRIQNTPSFSMIFAFRSDWNSPKGSQTLPRK